MPVAISQLGQVVSGMDAVHKIKKGAKEDNGAVTDPDKIVKMQLAADAVSDKKYVGRGVTQDRPYLGTQE